MSDAEKIATMLLRNSFHASTALVPFFGEDAAATIGGGLFQTGRFGRHEAAHRRKHLRQARLQELQEVPGQMRIRHGAEMLSIARRSEQSSIIHGGKTALAA